MQSASPSEQLEFGILRRVHHIAFNVRDLVASRRFWGEILGLRELVGEALPETLRAMVAAGRGASFACPDGTILDLFAAPELPPSDPDPTRQFSRCNHLAFDVAPEHFEQALAVLAAHRVPIDHGPVVRPTGRGIYFYDPDGFMVEIRCNA